MIVYILQDKLRSIELWHDPAMGDDGTPSLGRIIRARAAGDIKDLHTLEQNLTTYGYDNVLMPGEMVPPGAHTWIKRDRLASVMSRGF
jgi:hypothetical protein